MSPKKSKSPCHAELNPAFVGRVCVSENKAEIGWPRLRSRRFARSFHTCLGVAAGTPSSSTVWICEKDLKRQTISCLLLQDVGEETAPGSDIDFGKLLALCSEGPVMAVEGESGTKFCMAWAVWHFRIGSGRLEESCMAKQANKMCSDHGDQESVLNRRHGISRYPEAD